MDMDLSQVATKADVKGAVDALRTELDKKLAEARRSLSFQIVKVEADVREIKDKMATKSDIDRVITAMDSFAGKTAAYGRAAVLHGQALTEMQVELKSHERRLKRLESQS